MIIRPLSRTLVVVATVLALASCASPGSASPGDETAAETAVTPSFSFPAAPAAPDPSASSATDGAAHTSTGTGPITFTDGAAVHATGELFWTMKMSILSEHGFELDARDGLRSSSLRCVSALTPYSSQP